jgi:mono/diheme cytochrome c family protein
MGKTIINTIIVLLILTVVIGMLVIYSGWYNIAATAEHNTATLWLIETTKSNSIKSRAGNIEAPNLDDSSMVAGGFQHFDHECISCHGAPGIAC